MDLTRVAVSKFPRHLEAPADCLMTTINSRSGKSVAPAYSPGQLSGRRQYSFSRLTRHSIVGWLNRRKKYGSVGSTGHEPAPALLSMLGVFPCSVDNASRFRHSHALDAPEFTLFQSTPDPVDTAGWTGMVIQEGPWGRSIVIYGRKAAVNTSINTVLETAPFRGGQLRRLGGVSSDNSTCGCSGRSKVNDRRLSCLSFNEVTK